MSDRLDGRAVMVTGGAGFVGSHLVEELVRRGASVTVVDDLSTGRADNLAAVRERIALVEADVCVADLRRLLGRNRPDAVFHLAANGYVPPSLEDPRWDLVTNVHGTFNLLEAIREAAPDTAVVFASTAAVYGVGSSRPLEESSTTAPVAPYGVSKLAAERYVAVYATVYGLRSASLRLFPVFGPRMRKQVVYDFMCKLRDDPERLEILGDGSQVRTFNYVANAAAAFLLVARRAPLAGEVYNVATGHPITIRELAERVSSAMELQPRFEFTGSLRPGDAESWVADTSRLDALGYRPGVDLDEGLARTVEWFRNEGGG